MWQLEGRQNLIMKTLKDLGLLLMLFCIGSLVACSSEEEGSTDDPNIPTEFTPSQASTIYFSDGIDFAGMGNVREQEITFITNKSWSVSSTAVWCSVEPDHGSADEGSFRIVVEENPYEVTRDCVLTLKVGGMDNNITVRQGGVNSAKFHVAEAGTLISLLSTEYVELEDLTLTGELNGTDFRFLRDYVWNLGLNWDGLYKLDLTDARIVAGGERYYPSMPYYTQNDILSDYLLADCPAEELLLPSTIKAIGQKALLNVGAKSIVIPESVTSIGNYAFNWASLETIDIPNDETEIGRGAFVNCDRLKHVQLPKKLSYIAEELFVQCENLPSIEIPLSVDSIGEGAFMFCTSLKKLVIPKSVRYIGTNAWYGCRSLKTLEYHSKSIPEVVCLFASSVEYPPVNDILIGEEVEEIEAFAFEGFTELRTLIIPATVKKIGNRIFGDFNNMENLHMQSPTPPEMDSSDSDLGDVSQCNLYVPHGAKERYVSVGKPWTDFKAIIEE